MEALTGKIDALHERRIVAWVLAFAWLLLPFWLGLIGLTLSGLYGLWFTPIETSGAVVAPGVSAGPDGGLAVQVAAETATRLHYLALVGLTTVLAGLVGAPLAVLRVLNSERQTKVQEENHITDQINKAVEGLGTEKAVKRQRRDQQGAPLYAKHKNGKPDLANPLYEDITLQNIEVRVGAILSLERIARIHLSEHNRIMEILCTYIRENAPASGAPDLPKPPEWFDGKKGKKTWETVKNEWGEEHRAALKGVKPRTDIQTALDVIGRRRDKQKQIEWGDWRPYDLEAYPVWPEAETADGRKAWQEAANAWKVSLDAWKTRKPAYRLDLRNANLRGADLAEKDLNHASMNEAQMQGANLINAQMQGADLSEAQMQGAFLSDAQMQGAYLEQAQMQGAFLYLAQMQGAFLSEAQMQGAFLSEAQMQGADLSQAQFSPETNITAARFLLAAVECDLSMLKMDIEQVKSTFGDASTKLPEGMERPDFWPPVALDYFAFLAEWEKWKADPERYKWVDRK